MKLQRLGPWVAALVILGCVGFAAVRSWLHARTELDPDRITLRFAHWQLEAGVAEAFDELAREYERRHPQVRVIQMRIPEKSFSQWAMTQLIGGTAPDIIEIGHNLETVLQARYFEPITRFVNTPNPYNEGTELATVPWRSTFIDGLASGYSEKLADYFGVPCFFATVRVYYNRDLWAEITGRDAPPESFDEFLEVCARTREFSARTGRLVVPIAGSRDNAPYLLDQLFEGVNQKLAHRFTVQPMLIPSQDSFFLAYLKNEWTLDHPAIRAGLGLMRDVGRYMSPGFLQLRREDAIFYFSQGRALMMAAGSWEATGLRAQADFPLGVFRVPLPGPDHPRYGEFTWGAPSETSGRATTGPFGIYNGSRHFDQALDFLHFISSQPAHRKFVARSGWLPVVHGVAVPAGMQGFEPHLEGSLQGISLRWGTEIKRVTENHWHLLFSDAGGVDEFVAASRAKYRQGVAADLARRDRRSYLEMGLADPALEANRQILAHRPESAVQRLKYDAMLQAQNEREAYYYQMHYRLGEVESAP
jgi:raffinose/stachyose/melibiose transport system substrate-binding protein